MKTANAVKTESSQLQKIFQTAKKINFGILRPKKITKNLFAIAAIITLFILASGALIYTQSLSVTRAVSDSDELGMRQL